MSSRLEMIARSIPAVRRFMSVGFPYLFAIAVLALLARGWLREPSLTVIGAEATDVDVPACHGVPSAPATSAFKDPVCRMHVNDSIGAVIHSSTYYFCTEGCRTLFTADPAKYLSETCIVCRAAGSFVPVSEDLELTWQDETYRFCRPEHREAFRSDPGGYFLHTMWGIPSWLYYLSIGLILLFSFAVFERDSARKNTTGAKVDLGLSRPLRWLLTRRWVRLSAQAGVAGLFVLIIAAGLFGNQLPSKNIAPILTWTIWWGGLVLVILYFGKLWCYACPWDAIAGWVESLRFWGPRRGGLGLGLTPPRWLRNIWPAILLFVFLTWIELGLGVTLKPRATAYLALGILGLALASVLVFERKYFCRYVCLVGRISGLYALFAPVEVRSRDESVCRTCTTHSCYKGNAQGDGCPTWQFPGTMPNNTYCTMCAECLHTCELGNMTVRSRPWGEDLKNVRRPRLDEAFLALSLLSLSAFHGLTMTAAWRDLAGGIQEWAGIGRTLSFTAAMAAFLLGCLVLYAVLIAMARRLSGKRTPGYRECFVRYAYTFLPVAFLYHLAHNAEHLLMEGQKLVTLASDPFGWEWNLLGTSAMELPPLASLTTLWGIQVLLVIAGHVYGVWAASKVTARLYSDSRRRLAAHLPLLLAMVLFSILSLWLLKQPMEMRTSAM